MKQLLILITVLFFGSCAKQQGPVVPEIDPTTVSYAEDVQPIFDAYCISCHKAATEQYYGNLNLESGASYQDLVDVVSDGYNPQKRVTPEAVDNSVLWIKINESGALGSNMPLGAEALSATQQELIKIWIQEGALNN